MEKWIGGTENPHAVHEVTLHDLKGGGLSAISGWRTIQPVSLETVNFKRYESSILPRFFNKLTDREKHRTYYAR